MGKYVRYSDEFLDQVRKEADLVGLISRDITLKKSGKNFSACCPFHKEKTPSFSVSPERNFYRCYGCSAKGDAITWMMDHHHLPFPDAVAAVAEFSGIQLPETSQATAADQARNAEMACMYRALKDALALYMGGIQRNAKSFGYLTQQRALTPDTIEKYGLGTVGTGIADLLLKRHDRQTLIDCGLVCEAEDGRLFDRFRSRIMIPIYNQASALIGFAGRSVVEKPDRTPKYINSPETKLFRKGEELYAFHIARQYIRASKHAVVVEGFFDVISLHQAGDPRAVAPMGTALTNTQMRRLFQNADTVTFAFDGDKAGRNAALRSSAVVLEEMRDGTNAQFLFLPEGTDPDSIIREHGVDYWKDMLNQAQPLSQFLTDFVCHRLDNSIPESQVKAAERGRAVIARIHDAALFKKALSLQFERAIGISLSA
ncbi:DNA primase [Pseudomonas monteilii]|uniref:DNA primase n=1 Tax=Pseudomonas monteilii TaxID=76759 RepID=UPI003D00F8F2